MKSFEYTIKEPVGLHARPASLIAEAAAWYKKQDMTLAEGLEMLYEKYGYRCLKDIVNYGGGTDRLYVKELK